MKDEKRSKSVQQKPPMPIREKSYSFCYAIAITFDCATCPDLRLLNERCTCCSLREAFVCGVWSASRPRARISQWNLGEPKSISPNRLRRAVSAATKLSKSPLQVSHFAWFVQLKFQSGNETRTQNFLLESCSFFLNSKVHISAEISSSLERLICQSRKPAQFTRHEKRLLGICFSGAKSLSTPHAAGFLFSVN